ncbi:MAG: hypothetical protein HYS13_11225 [Planctomycetia bacterium]|nr:hypothetical protein [Planctomycetia bacterium]
MDDHERDEAVLTGGKPHAAALRKDDSLQPPSLVNDNLVTGYQGDFAALKADSWHRINDKESLAIFCDDPTVFRKFELVEISGAGKKLR